MTTKQLPKISHRAVKMEAGNLLQGGYTPGYRKDWQLDLYLDDMCFATLIQLGSGRIKMICRAREHSQNVSLSEMLAVTVNTELGERAVSHEDWTADDWKGVAKQLSKELRALNK
ncbi:hypothetical protein [Sorangium sp. So ce542]|uniref:hypothetical protein n=1 Tax=Sorangium sp. So ce542 TaxID=3133316 RepID=UPI003F5E005A